MEDDFLLALRLQEQFDTEYQTASSSAPSNRLDDAGQSSSKKRRLDVSPSGGSGAFPRWEKPERPLSIVDASWETLDPSPDVRAMFLDFNHTFFWGKLSGVEVKWSPRMTLCAGVCSYEGRGGLCSIRLSEPLLKLRPRKDLVETLLHEMIHALLFVTANNRDRDGHGPEFCKHMNRINDATGTSISVYHSFHDEVDAYRQHWWRCDGPCQNRKPYFGYVKRAMNRVPSAQDPWWADHQRTCGGTYTKIKEPEGYGQKGKKNGKTDGKTLAKEASGSGKPSSTATGSGLQDIRNMIPFTGKGFLLGGRSQTSTPPPPPHKPPVPLVKTPSSNPVFSPPKKLFPPSSPAKALTSPFHSGTSGAFPSSGTGTSTGKKPPKKRSVGNTRVFVSINGSPVRIPKPHSSSRSQVAEKTRQSSIEDLFDSTGVRGSSGAETRRDSLTSPETSTSTALVSSLFPRQQGSSSARTPKPGPAVVLNRDSPDQPTQSKYFNSDSSSGAAAAGSQSSRKRPWDERSGSASIFDYFQKTLSTDSAASRESVKTRSPAVQQRTVTATATASSSSSNTSSLSAPSSSSSSSSSSSLTVSCPVCQTKVQQSKINEHLDSCLS